MFFVKFLINFGITMLCLGILIGAPFAIVAGVVYLSTSMFQSLDSDRAILLGILTVLAMLASFVYTVIDYNEVD